jgi:RimJ/RimL family protein N-acetyltransferase
MDGTRDAPSRFEVPTLYTERLILRRLELSDAPAIQMHFAHWEIVKLLNVRVPWPYPEDGALAFLQNVVLPAMQAGKQWHWSLRLREAPEQLIGTVSLMDGESDNRGFWLGLPWQGQGLMREASDAVTAYWFDVLERPLMQVPKAAGNAASRKISQRQGMRLVAEQMGDYVSGRLMSEVWEITREEWLARRR